MSFFATKTQVVQIDAENSITVRTLSYGEEQDIMQRARKVGAKIPFGANGQPAAEQVGEITFDQTMLERHTLRKCIVSWDGPGFDGRPVTIENIEALPSYVLDPVIEACRS